MGTRGGGHELTIPEFALVALVGVSGSGKSTFAKAHFKATEILSSDFFRGLVSDDENDQAATGAAFDALYYIARKRLAALRLTVVDATNVQKDARRKILALAKEYDVLPVAIVLNVPTRVCAERNASRPDRQFGDHVLRNQASQLRRSLKQLRKEGFRYVHVLDSVEAVEEAAIERQRLWTNRRDLHGPFDIIGDVHGCADELLELFEKLGYRSSGTAESPVIDPPEGRTAVFLGDLVDRGPDSPRVLRIAMDMVGRGVALCVPGNHDVKLVKWLRGKNVKIAHGLEETISQLETEGAEFRHEVEQFLDGLVSHLVLDDGKLVVAHAGLRAEYQGRASGRVRAFALYGETTGETDEFGLPIRYDWAMEYKSGTAVVYGHTPVPEAEWLNNTINIDTGCVFGGELTALRYPERELVSVAAHQVYQEPVRPIDRSAARSGQHLADDLLDAADVLGKRIIRTEGAGTVTIREENSAAALEVISRFAVDPRWLIYLPPTMSPPATSREESYLEHPAEAFEYYRDVGVDEVVCQSKHMGSRALMVVCRTPEVARSRFGTEHDSWGAAYTRTGRPFFDEPLGQRVLERASNAIGQVGLWERLETEWVLLDCEVMPWSFKAVELLRSQYAAVGAAATTALADAVSALSRAEERGIDTSPLRLDFEGRRDNAEAFVQAYRNYCWPFNDIEDLSIAPFHLLASEGRVHTGELHRWHIETLSALVEADPGLITGTVSRSVSLKDREAVAAAVDWWIEVTTSGAEGMVVKPPTFSVTRKGRLIQPAVKCRGPDYLRIIYGPDYQLPRNLDRLRERGLGRKRSLALREAALGVEALQRFVNREPLRRVHECVFGVLALESEPVDPRL